MALEWLKNLLPILNATGVPLLAVAVILLVVAYRYSAEVYERVANGLRAENDRLRERLATADTTYASELDRIRNISRASISAIEELQARKVALLSQDHKPVLTLVGGDPIDVDVERINQAIRALRELSEVGRQSDLRIRETLLSVERHFRDVETGIGELVDRIGDTKGRLALVSVLASGAAVDDVRRAVAGVPRGRTTDARDLRKEIDRLNVARDEMIAQLPAAPTEEQAG